MNKAVRYSKADEYRLLQLEKEAWKRQCQNDLTSWCCEALQHRGQAPARHHRLLISYLEKVDKGEIDRLAVFMPPGSAKSTYCSELFPAWWMIHHPHSAVIAASHTAELAERFGRRVRNLVESNSEILGYGLDPSNRSASRWETTHGSEYFSAGVGGSITGRRADLAIIDDPVKSRESAESEIDREKTYAWYTSDLYTRLKPGAAIILIMTRWHLYDLGGRLLADMQNGGDKWTVLLLPGLSVYDDDPLGRRIGEALWPEWEDRAALERKRATLGVRDFSALYQGDPQPPGGSFFSIEDILVNNEPIEAQDYTDTVFAIIDTAVKTGSKHDATAVIYFQMNKRLGHPLVILDYDLIQIEGATLIMWIPSVFRQLGEYAETYHARFGSLGALVEDKASGTILIQQCNNMNYPARAIDSTLTSVGKDERAISVSGYVKQGKVKISEKAYRKTMNFKGRHANHLLTQIFEFVIGVKDQSDDLLDCFCYGVATALGDDKGI